MLPDGVQEVLVFFGSTRLDSRTPAPWLLFGTGLLALISLAEGNSPHVIMLVRK
jgi:hypothetical protein